ncbi:hypothetical protein [Lamprobacter modestohalophilus]|nr:hypothetical protein [Lamprobacter modestohalophilus]
MQILHHGAIDGVTGSCHQLILADGRSLLIAYWRPRGGDLAEVPCPRA